MPDDVLWEAVEARWPHAVRELPAGVPGRRFRLDIGFEQECLAIEVDGFQYHAKFKKHFQSDIDRQNELVIHGWRVIRFSAGDVFRDVEQCVATIERALNGRSWRDK